MDLPQPQGLLALTVIVAASLLGVVYVFLRMAGVAGRDADGHGRPPPRTPMG